MTHTSSLCSAAPVTGSTEDPVIELAVDARRYRIVLPHATQDHIQKRLAADRTPYEGDMLRDMKKRLAPADLVLDVGANIGNHTLYLAAIVGCRVVAFEPNEALCGALLRSIELNQLGEQVRLRCLALGNEAGQGDFEKAIPSNLGAQRISVGAGSIPIATLDSLGIAETVKAIKLDVEGMELSVLQGGAELLRRCRPLLYVECQTEPEYRAVAQWLEAFDYGYFDTFNATPTHLFIPNEQVLPDQRIGQMQRRAVLDAYRAATQLDKVRGQADQSHQKLTQAHEHAARLSERLLAAEQAQAASQLHAASLQTDLAVVRAQLDAKSSAHEQLLRELHAHRDARQAQQAELAALKLSSARISDEVHSHRLELDRSRQEAEAAQAQIATLEQSLDLLHRELGQAQAHSQSLTLQLTQLQAAEALARTRGSDAQARLAVLQKDLQAAKEREARQGTEIAQLAREMRALQESRREVLARNEDLSQRLSRATESRRQDETLMRQVFQLHEALASRERRAREAALAANVRAERVHKHLSYRLGKAIVDNAKAPSRWLHMPSAIWKACDAFQSERDVGKVDHNAALVERLDADKPHASVCLHSQWQRVSVSNLEVTRELWVRALSVASDVEIDTEWVLHGPDGTPRTSHEALPAGEYVRIGEVPVAQQAVCVDVRKLAGKPCILQMELRTHRLQGSPASAKPVVAPVKGPAVKAPLAALAAPAMATPPASPVPTAPLAVSAPAQPALPDATTLSYRHVPAMERPAGGQTAAALVFDEDPLISVVMTTYNTEEFVESAIDSILRQTWRNLELIVVDDCSTDSTRERVRALAQRDARVRLHVFGDNRGTYWCKNFGMTLARGEVVTFMDSDDLSAPTRLAEQFAELNQVGRVMVTCNLVRKDGEGQVIAINGQVERIAPISKMIKRQVIREIGYFDSIRTSADDEFMQRVKLVYGRAAHANVAKVLYIALVREQSLTTDPENAINLAAAQNGQAYLSAPRKHFADSYAGWHRSLGARGLVPYVPFPVVNRPFPVYGKLVVSAGRYEHNPVSVCLASFPPRREQLRKTVAAIIDRVDNVFIYLNGYEEVPDFLDHPRIHVTLGVRSVGDLRDNGKFFLAETVPDGYCFTIDDDIDYPVDYFEALIRKIEFYDRKAVVGVHGTIFGKPFESYFQGRTLFHFRDAQPQDRIVNQLGTGTVAFHTQLIRPQLDWFTLKGMADAFFACELKARRVALISVARPKAWLTPQDGGDLARGNLFEEFRHNDALQTQVIAAQSPFDESVHGALREVLASRIEAFGPAFAEQSVSLDAPEEAAVQAGNTAVLLQTRLSTSVSAA